MHQSFGPLGSLNTPAIFRSAGRARLVLVQDVTPNFVWFTHVRGPDAPERPARYFAPKDAFDYGADAIAAHVAFALGFQAASWPDSSTEALDR